jgi:hypothetical protein
MCPGVDSVSKNEYQETPGGKNGRCLRVTTLPTSLCRKSRRSGALTYRIPKGLLRPVAGKLYLYLQTSLLAIKKAVQPSTFSTRNQYNLRRSLQESSITFDVLYKKAVQPSTFSTRKQYNLRRSLQEISTTFDVLYKKAV